MNEQDKKAYRKWFETSYLDVECDWTAEAGWEGALEYERERQKFVTPPAVFIYEEMYNKEKERSKILELKLNGAIETLTNIAKLGEIYGEPASSKVANEFLSNTKDTHES